MRVAQEWGRGGVDIVGEVSAIGLLIAVGESAMDSRPVLFVSSWPDLVLLAAPLSILLFLYSVRLSFFLTGLG